MKRCPQCGAEYDEHVQFCFIDGSELSAVSSTPPVAPAPVASPPPAGESGGARRSTFVPLLLLLLGGGALVAVIAVIGVGLAVSRGPTPPPEPLPRPAPVAAVPPPAPVEPPPAPAARVAFETEPPGAEVWEGETLLCLTPCDVEHPDHAPLPRDFLLKAAGREDTPWQMTDASGPQRVTLKAAAPRTGPARPKPPPKSDILFER